MFVWQTFVINKNIPETCLYVFHWGMKMNDQNLKTVAIKEVQKQECIFPIKNKKQKKDKLSQKIDF